MITIAGVPGFSIGGVHSSEFGIYLAKKYIDLLPETRDYELTIFGKDGVKDYDTQLDKRKIPLVLKMQGESRQDLNDNLDRFAALLDPRKGYQQLILDDDQTRYRYVKYSSGISNSTVDYIIDQGNFTLGLKATDPFKYSLASKTISWSTASGGSLQVINGGLEETPPIIEIRTRNGVTLPSGVTLTINGVAIKYLGEITVNDVITMDIKAMDVFKNGALANRYWDGDFPELQAGANTITESDVGNIGADITITYTERWM